MPYFYLATYFFIAFLLNSFRKIFRLALEIRFYYNFSNKLVGLATDPLPTGGTGRGCAPITQIIAGKSPIPRLEDGNRGDRGRGNDLAKI